MIQRGAMCSMVIVGMKYCGHSGECEHKGEPEQPVTWRIGEKYNWTGQPERLVYLGRNWSGNGYWHQFEKVDEPGTIWCEVLDADLSNFEETRPTANGAGGQS